MDYFLNTNDMNSWLLDVKYHNQIEGSDHCPISLTLKSELDQLTQNFDSKVSLLAKRSHREAVDAGDIDGESNSDSLEGEKLPIKR